ncbi:hypothetical protein EVG20_g8271 [Dentipellis fragilis]|uniref:Transcription activator of gluconeogenesis ERT1 n=1 Tax=Dentipellis fragilis TaxID=205917 RepID=A0A4Y9Y9A2_9AGAM|nr:hypothetical protein EVG20_g8271 [Dentipellis fragilis]
MHPTLATIAPSLGVNPASLSSPASFNGSRLHLQNGFAGPSTESGGSSKRATSAGAKRRRSEGANDSGDGLKKDGQKKKKANRACVHCQKAHLTCDDSRPCQRCTKRGIADTCVEGHRKRAKYLLDDEELEQLKKQKGGSSTPAVQAPAPIPTSEPFPPNDPLFNAPFDPAFPFGSEAANLEYSILSAILGNPSPDSQHTTSPPPAHSYASSTWPSDSLGTPSLTSAATADPNDFLTSPGGLGSTRDVFDQESSLGLALAADNASSRANIPAADFLVPAAAYSPPPPQASRKPASATSSPTVSMAPHPAMGYPAQPPPQPAGEPLHPLAPRWPPSTTDSTYVFCPDTAPRSRTAAFSSMSGMELARQRTSQEVYETVTAPYDYTEGYHFLMKYLPKRFEKNDILRIVRALAIFRPSLIALQMPLTEEDEVFVEKCFQRSIIELDKLISYSGTPTVAWRRTGEICLVGPEFCILTEWSKDELLGKKKYIWEIFENQSVVEYWENFATHAFENTTQSVYSHCVLLKPSGVPVPATFCFSIRRDIFDLPSLVIGQWLPLL